jgi:DNA-binding beta-propeller fold protein YncE
MSPANSAAPPITEPAAGSAAIAQPMKPGTPAPLLPSKVLMRRVAMIEIPGRPGFNGTALYEGNLLLAHPAASTVDVFSVAKRRVIAQIKDMKGADGIVVDAKAGKAYVANSDAKEIAVVSLKDWSVDRRIPLNASPRTLLLVPELHLLMASNWRDLSVSEIDLANYSVGNTVVVGGRPSYMAFDPTAKQVYVSLEDQNAIAVLDPSLKLVKRIPLDASLPTGLAIDPQSRRLFVSVRYAVVALDLDSGSEINRVAAPAGVDALWFEPARTRLYAAANGSVLVMSTKGRLAVEREWPTDVKGHTLAFDSGKDMIYVPGGWDGRSKLLLLRSLDTAEQQAAALGYLPGEKVAAK